MKRCFVPGEKLTRKESQALRRLLDEWHDCLYHGVGVDRGVKASMERVYKAVSTGRFDETSSVATVNEIIDTVQATLDLASNRKDAEVVNQVLKRRIQPCAGKPGEIEEEDRRNIIVNKQDW